jgi:hypothetical protein
MRRVAIGRVLGRPLERSAIGSPRDFRPADLSERTAHEDENAAEADRVLAARPQSGPDRDWQMLAALFAANRSPTPGGSAGVTALTDAGSERTGEGPR